MGPEPYSLAILLRENVGYMYFRNVNILATDIDQSQQFEKIIAEGRYPKDQVERIPEDILARYFKADGSDEIYQISEEIRKSVHFLRHDLLSLQPPAENLDLILCKNVLLHFSQQERVEVFRMFHRALSVGGFLAVEQTQKLPDELKNSFVQVVSQAQLFQKI